MLKKTNYGRPTSMTRVADLKSGDYIESKSLGSLLEIDHVEITDRGVQIVLKPYCTHFPNPDFRVKVL